MKAPSALSPKMMRLTSTFSNFSNAARNYPVGSLSLAPGAGHQAVTKVGMSGGLGLCGLWAITTWRRRRMAAINFVVFMSYIICWIAGVKDIIFEYYGIIGKDLMLFIFFLVGIFIGCDRQKPKGLKDIVWEAGKVLESQLWIEYCPSHIFGLEN